MNTFAIVKTVMVVITLVVQKEPNESGSSNKLINIIRDER
jgi:hypothetical protein